MHWDKEIRILGGREEGVVEVRVSIPKEDVSVFEAYYQRLLYRCFSQKEPELVSSALYISSDLTTSYDTYAH